MPETAAETTTAITTTEEETTTQKETTTEAPFVPTSGESNGVRWRTLDLEDEVNAEVKAWLEGHMRRERPREIPMGEGKTLLSKDKESIVLRDDATGKETVLLELRYVGEKDDPANDDTGWGGPWLEEIIDERYFVVSWIGYECIRGVSIYDTQEMREIPVLNPIGVLLVDVGIHNGLLYMCDFNYGEGSGQMHIYAIPLDNLEKAEALPCGENLLAGIPEADMSETYYNWQLISPDARYLAVDEIIVASAVRIFDLKAKSFVCRLPVALNDRYPDLVFRDEHTLYCYERGWDGENPIARGQVIEITLP